MQHVPFIFSETACGTAATIVDASADDFGRILYLVPAVRVLPITRLSDV